MSSRVASSNPSFDFPKSRKRWPEILLTELAGVIVLLLSPRGKILYCGAGVHDILGWQDSEVVAMDSIRDLVTTDDFTTFLDSFRSAIQTNSEMLSYTRFKSKPPPDAAIPPMAFPAQTTLQNYEHNPILLEVKGYPYFTETGPQGFFAVCAPYPSKSLEMLNCILPLKLEHERLRDRAAFLRSCLPPDALPQIQNPQSPIEIQASSYLNLPIDEEDGMEDITVAPKKVKRPRKAGAADQHVCSTCGRTDSPEWRKGPLGPKTLCNACGLRWSKQAKKNSSEG